jgi:hypothetical protein
MLDEREHAASDDHQRPPLTDRLARVQHAAGVEQEQHADRDDHEAEQQPS